MASLMTIILHIHNVFCYKVAYIDNDSRNYLNKKLLYFVIFHHKCIRNEKYCNVGYVARVLKIHVNKHFINQYAYNNYEFEFYYRENRKFF